MTLRRLLPLFLLALSTSVHAGGWIVRPDGAGPLKVGMTLDDVNKTLGDHLQPTPPGERGSPHCYQLEPARQPGLLLMFIDDVLKRVDVMEEGIASDRGVRLGDPVSKVQRVYGKGVLRSPAPYVEGEQTLMVRSRDGQYALRFATGDGRIAELAAGAWKEIQYDEGCL